MILQRILSVAWSYRSHHSRHRRSHGWATRAAGHRRRSPLPHPTGSPRPHRPTCRPLPSARPLPVGTVQSPRLGGFSKPQSCSRRQPRHLPSHPSPRPQPRAAPVEAPRARTHLRGACGWISHHDRGTKDSLTYSMIYTHRSENNFVKQKKISKNK